MKLFGIELSHPSPRNLAVAAIIILMFLAINLVMPATNDDRLDRLFPDLAAIAIGAISASFGINPIKGWRECALLLAISMTGFVVVRLLTRQALAN